MNNQEILKRAMHKAVDNGLTGYWADRFEFCLKLGEMGYFVDGNNLEDGKSLESLLYDHEFAESLWGEDFIDDGELTGRLYVGGGMAKEPKPVIPKWKVMLQQMVIADDPIKYLGEHL